MKHILIAASAAALLLAPTMAFAVQTTMQIELSGSGDIQRHTMTYDCAVETPLTVTYINAAPNYLAIVPVAEEPEELIFASVISASGVRYASGKWIWWTKGADASLYDETLGEDAEPVLTCSEINNTP